MKNSIHKLMESLSFNQREFAEAVGCHEATVSRWIDGNRKPCDSHAFKILEIARGAGKKITLEQIKKR